MSTLKVTLCDTTDKMIHIRTIPSSSKWCHCLHEMSAQQRIHGSGSSSEHMDRLHNVLCPSTSNVYITKCTSSHSSSHKHAFVADILSQIPYYSKTHKIRWSKFDIWMLRFQPCSELFKQHTAAPAIIQYWWLQNWYKQYKGLISADSCHSRENIWALRKSKHIYFQCRR